MPDSQNFFWIAASVAEIAADSSNGNKTLLHGGVNTVFLNGKPAAVNGLRKLRNRPSWLVIFLVAPFNKIPLLSKDLITFITSFISLFVRVIPAPKTFLRSFEIYLEVLPVFIMSLSDTFLLNKSSALLGILPATLEEFAGSKILGLKILDPYCIILENWVSENFLLADEPYAKALQIFETFVLVNNIFCGKLISSLEFPIVFIFSLYLYWIHYIVTLFSNLFCSIQKIYDFSDFI